MNSDQRGHDELQTDHENPKEGPVDNKGLELMYHYKPGTMYERLGNATVRA